MDEITLTKTRFRKEQWKQLILDCQNSGMTILDWCAQQGVTKHTYYYWLRRIREDASHALPAAQEENRPVCFKKLEVSTPVFGTEAAVIIRLPSATLEVREGTNRQTVEAVLLALKSIC